MTASWWSGGVARSFASSAHGGPTPQADTGSGWALGPSLLGQGGGKQLVLLQDGASPSHAGKDGNTPEGRLALAGLGRQCVQELRQGPGPSGNVRLLGRMSRDSQGPPRNPAVASAS